MEGGGYFPPKLLQILGGSGENAQLLYHGKVCACSWLPHTHLQ